MPKVQTRTQREDRHVDVKPADANMQLKRDWNTFTVKKQNMFDKTNHKQNIPTIQLWENSKTKDELISTAQTSEHI